jgi:hypothetical protein
MSATVHALGRSSNYRPLVSRPAPPPRAPETGAWLVDVAALARARSVFSGHEPPPIARGFQQQALLEVPVAYAAFCRSHFATVRRLHPEMSWDDACPAYAVALGAHAALCDALDAEAERRLAQHWESIRGASRLAWPQAAPLVADGCSALARLDPLAMRR